MGHRVCLGDLMGQTYPIYACTGSNLARVISSVHGAFCSGWKKGFLKEQLKNLDR